MIGMSMFTSNDESKLAFGYTFIAFIGLVMIVNIGFAIYCTILDTRRGKRLESIKQSYEKILSNGFYPAKEAKEAESARKVARDVTRHTYLKKKGYSGGLKLETDIFGKPVALSDSEEEHDEDAR